MNGEPIYHIVSEADFRAHNDGRRYLPADFDASGFVHCALEVSVLPVANDYYSAVSEPLQLHICVCCGRLLGDDPEDELDGEGPGRDICGDCNRWRNDEAIEEFEESQADR